MLDTKQDMLSQVEFLKRQIKQTFGGSDTTIDLNGIRFNGKLKFLKDMDGGIVAECEWDDGSPSFVKNITRLEESDENELMAGIHSLLEIFERIAVRVAIQ